MKTGKYLNGLGVGNDFFTKTPTALVRKENTDKLDCITTGNFSSWRDITEWVKQHPVQWENTSALHVSNKGLIQYQTHQWKKTLQIWERDLTGISRVYFNTH